MIGIDVGFSETKIYPGNLHFPSVYCDYRERLVSLGNDNLMDNLLLEYNGNKHLIGNLARKENGAATFDKENQKRHILCMLTGIALSQGNYSGPIVLGLPISDLKKKDTLALLKGEYQVNLSGTPYNIDITDVHVFPQGAACYFDILLSDEGKPVGPYMERKVGVIDIGEKTVDFVTMDKGQIVMERSGSLEYGMHKAYLRLLTIIQSDLGISCLPHQVRDYLSRIPTDTEKQFRNLANEIVDNISVWWNYRDFDNIYLAGGGSVALQKYITERIKCELIPDSQFANARGFFKCGQSIQS